MTQHTKAWALAALAAALISGCGGVSQSVGPDGIQQNAGPFHQSVGANGISQGTGGYGPSQSVGPNGIYQNAGGVPARKAAGSSCQINCGGQGYVANCPTGSTPVCQCSSQPYAGCLSPSR